jgi:lipoyl(octanoyl) transferase
MALDDGLLQTAQNVFARRYTWAPPALSIGKFQQVRLLPDLPFDVIRRPTGGRAVLHGEGFEWSFAVVFPQGSLGAGPGGLLDVTASYGIVVTAFREALAKAGVALDATEEAGRPAAFCFAGVMRHDLLAGGEKVVAVAQAREGRRVLVHGSVLERRPPVELTNAAEDLLGEPWRGEGFAGAGCSPARDPVWASVLDRLETGLRAGRAARESPAD